MGQATQLISFHNSIEKFDLEVILCIIFHISKAKFKNPADNWHRDKSCR